MSKYKVSFVVVMILSALVYMLQYSSRPRQYYQPILKYTPTDMPTNLPWSIKDVWNHLKPVFNSDEKSNFKPDAPKTSTLATTTKSTPVPTATRTSRKTNATQAKTTSTTSIQNTSNVKTNATQARPTASTGVHITTNVKTNATQPKPTSTTLVQSTINVKPNATQQKPTAKKNETKSVTSITAKVTPTSQTMTPLIGKVTPTVQTVTPTLPPTTTPKTTKYLCVNFNGRLGNHMYMFASGFGISRRHGMRLVVKPDSTIKAVFNVDGAYETDWDLCNGAKTVGENGCCRVSPHIYNMSNDRSHVVSGYLQSFKYFDEYKEELRHLFTFREPVLKEAKTKLSKLFENQYKGKNVSNRTLVGVHVRRGDYLSPGSIKFGYKVATLDFMHRAVKYMNDHFTNVTYIVCSNDVKWTTETLKNETDVIIVPMGPAHVDMAVLSLTDHMIMTVGTYGFWASWLVNGTVVYFRNFTDPKTPFGKNFDDGYHDTFPPNWIGL